MTKSAAQAAEKANFLTGIMAQPFLLLTLASLFWGGNAVAGKLAVGQIDPYFMVICRWAGALLVLSFVSLPHVKRDWPKIRQHLPLLLLYGAIGYALANTLFYVASYFTAAVNISIELASVPIFVLLGNFIIFRVQIKPVQIAGLALTIAGVIWVATHGNPASLLTLGVNRGDGLVILACIALAAYSLALKYSPDIHWLSFIFITATGALVSAFIFQAGIGGGLQHLIMSVPKTSLLGWGCVFYAALFPSILSQLFYARSVQLTGPNRAAIFTNLVPVFGIILSVIILGEAFEVFHVIASVLIVAGIALSEWGSKEKQT